MRDDECYGEWPAFIPVKSIFDYTDEPKPVPAETHPLDGHYMLVNNKEVWIPREQKQCK